MPDCIFVPAGAVMYLYCAAGCNLLFCLLLSRWIRNVFGDEIWGAWLAISLLVIATLYISSHFGVNSCNNIIDANPWAVAPTNIP